MTKTFAGVYTGKYSVGQRVHSGDHYPTGRYYGTIISVLAGRSREHEFGPNNAYGVQWDGDVHDDGTPSVTFMSETDIEAA